MTVLGCDAEEAAHSRKLPLLFRVDVPVNSDSLAGVRLGPSIAFPGTIGVLGVDAKDDAVKKVEEGDRVTHVNGVAIGSEMADVRRVLSESKGKAVVQFMKKRNPWVKRPYHSASGRAHSDDDAVARCEPSVAAEEEIHGKDLDMFAYFLYEVRADDALNNIAASFGVKVDEVRADNRDKFELGCPGHIYPGEVLRIRNKDYVRLEGSPSAPWAPVLASPCKACVTSSATRIRGTHEVEAKDTLESIAAMYEMTVAEVRSYNRKLFPAGEPSHLEAGMKLLVFRPQYEVISGKASPKNGQFKAWSAPVCA